MKILYLANIRFPTEKAHGVQIMKTCEAFAEAGHEVELVVPNRMHGLKVDPFTYYGIRTVFKITTLSVLDVTDLGKVGFILHMRLFGAAAQSLIRKRKPDVVYGRDEIPLLAAQRVAPVIWESHIGSYNRAAQKLIKRGAKIVVISEGLKKFYDEKGVSSKRILTAPDGIDLRDFASLETREQSRSRLGLPLDKKIVLYIGRVDGWKGVDVLCEAATLLPPEIMVVVIGGDEEQVADMQHAFPKVSFIGYRPYREVGSNQAAADVLILPNTGKDVLSSHYTSPLKLFTYMASNRPIVVSDLSSIREVLEDNDAFFVTPDDSALLAEKIQQALNNTEDAEARARSARARVEHFTWKSRTDKILSFIQDTHA